MPVIQRLTCQGVLALTLVWAGLLGQPAQAASWDQVGRYLRLLRRMNVEALVAKDCPAGLLGAFHEGRRTLLLCGNNLPDTEAALAEMVAVAGATPVISKANAGIPHWHGTELVYSGSPDVMGAHAHRVRSAGVSVIGGCCGNDPSHIAAIRGVLDGTLPVPEVDFTPAERAPTEARRRSRRRG